MIDVSTRAQSFIDKAKSIHGDMYDYSDVEYVNTHTRVIIICREHGKFNQSPVSHTVNKSGCPKCSNDKRKATNLEKYGVENFTQTSTMGDIIKSRSMEKYGVDNPRKAREVQDKIKQTMLEKYGVEQFASSSKFRDVSMQTKLAKHGDASYTNRDKAKQSWFNRYGVDNPRKAKEVQDKIKQTMLEKYGVEYPNQSVDILEKTKNAWIEKYGVDNPMKDQQIREKAKLTNLERYGFKDAFLNSDVQQKQKQTNLERYGTPVANQKHMIGILPLLQDYDWLHDQYINQQKTATQIAHELELDPTTIGRYLKKAEIEIRKYHHSYTSVVWIESIMESENIHIQHALNGGEYQIPGTRWKADGYCAETNTIYEFHGDYWHGNPLVYDTAFYNKSLYKTMGELYQKTINREEVIKSMGYNLVVKWETEYDN